MLYLEVMALLKNVSLNVVAISVDNAATNRKFFVDLLCAGALQTHIIDVTTGQPIGVCLSAHQWTEFCQTDVLQSLITSWGYTTQSQPCR